MAISLPKNLLAQIVEQQAKLDAIDDFYNNTVTAVAMEPIWRAEETALRSRERMLDHTNFVWRSVISQSDQIIAESANRITDPSLMRSVQHVSLTRCVPESSSTEAVNGSKNDGRTCGYKHARRRLTVRIKASAYAEQGEIHREVSVMKDISTSITPIQWKPCATNDVTKDSVFFLFDPRCENGEELRRLFDLWEKRLTDFRIGIETEALEPFIENVYVKTLDAAMDDYSTTVTEIRRIAAEEMPQTHKRERENIDNEQC